VLGWVALFGGAGLIYAAVADKRPIATLTAALTGSTTSTPASFGALFAALPAGTNLPATTVPATTSGSSAGSTPGSGGPVDQSATVPVGTIRLIPAAAAAFVAWQGQFGQSIPCTSGWRSVAVQASGFASNPERFASPQTSWHTAGKAVDVDNNWLGALPAATQSKLRLAAVATGWRQARWAGEAKCGNPSGSDNEPWHFSWGGCG
jgi:hypothetical protein